MKWNIVEYYKKGEWSCGRDQKNKNLWEFLRGERRVFENSNTPKPKEDKHAICCYLQLRFFHLTWMTLLKQVNDNITKVLYFVRERERERERERRTFDKLLELWSEKTILLHIMIYETEYLRANSWLKSPGMLCKGKVFCLKPRVIGLFSSSLKSNQLLFSY